MGAGAIGSSNDPYFEQVVLLLHLDGTNGDNIFTDSSNAHWAISSQNFPITSTTQFKYGTASMRAQFANERVYNNSTMPSPLTGDFTLECWVYRTNASGNQIIFIYGDYTASTGFEVYVDPSGAVRMYSQAERWATSNGVITLNTWQHVAVVRASGVVSCYVGGILVGQVTWANSISQAAAGISHSPAGWVGYLDEYRYTKNIARYTANFTPPTAAFPNTSGNTYATWNPSDQTNATLTLGNLKIAATSGGTAVGARATVGKSTGKYYWEVTRGASGSATEYIGISTSGASFAGGPVDALIISTGGGIYNSGSYSGSVTAPGANAVIGFALDAGAKTLTIYVNNILQGTYTYTFSNPVYPRWACLDNGTGNSGTANFGASPFAYTVPDGYNPGLF